MFRVLNVTIVWKLVALVTVLTPALTIAVSGDRAVSAAWERTLFGVKEFLAVGWVILEGGLSWPKFVYIL